MEQREGKRRTVIILVIVMLLALLLGGYAIFMRQSGTSATAPRIDAAHLAQVRIDAGRPRPDVARPPDSAPANADAEHKTAKHAGARALAAGEPSERASAAAPEQIPPKPDAAAARAPDAARKPDAARRVEKLPPMPKLSPPKPAHVVARLRNRMGSSFVLIQLSYEIDGRSVYDREDLTGGLDRTRDFDAFTGTLPPGRHNLIVHAVYRGAAHGVFTYHEGYKYKVRSDYTFAVNPGKRTEITVEAYERGNAATPIEQRPALKFGYLSTNER